MSTYTVIWLTPDEQDPSLLSPGWIDTPEFHDIDQATDWFCSRREELGVPANAQIDSIRRNKPTNPKH